MPPVQTNPSMMSIGARLSRVVLPLLVLSLVSAACGSKESSAADRPSTAARLQIVQPEPNAVTGPDLTIGLQLTGGQIVQAVSGPLRGDQGHIHVSIDGKLISMAYGTTQDLHGLASGPHTMTAEYVATDHAPFKNRVIAAVLFQVQP
ncbi:MAG: hypothetical protein M3066_07910 [Actinomycetota bacterium]|nr:hypothetical protein [Actinomycetota bacterium]